MSVQGSLQQRYYGWTIVAALFVVLIFSSGLGFYNHAVMLQAVTAEKGLPITITSTAVSLFFLVSGLCGLFIADLLERVDVRWVVATGAVISAVALLLIGHVSTSLQLFMVYALFGLGFTASGLLPATTLVARWFTVKRAQALSIASTGLSVGGIVITPASAVLVAKLGITEACVIFALVYLFGVLPVALLVLRSWPEKAVPAASGAVAANTHDLSGVPFARAVRSRFFWGLSLAYVLVMMAQVGGIAHQYGLVQERLPVESATLALSILPMFSVVGRLLGGYLLGSWPILGFTFAMMLLQALALGLMAAGANEPVIMLGLALFGLSVGNLLMLQPLLIAEVFGLQSYSRIYAFSNFLTTLGVASGPAILGWAYTLGSEYVVPYGLASGAAGAAMVVFIVVSGGTRLPSDWRE